jgi:hypothetical protein
MVPEGDAGAAAGVEAAGGVDDWLFNMVPKSVADAAGRLFDGRSDLRLITGAVYVGCGAVLNVGMT